MFAIQCFKTGLDYGNAAQTYQRFLLLQLSSPLLLFNFFLLLAASVLVAFSPALILPTQRGSSISSSLATLLSRALLQDPKLLWNISCCGMLIRPTSPIQKLSGSPAIDMQNGSSYRVYSSIIASTTSISLALTTEHNLPMLILPRAYGL